MRRSASEPVPNDTGRTAANNNSSSSREQVRCLYDLVEKDLRHVKLSFADLMKYVIRVKTYENSFSAEIEAASAKLETLKVDEVGGSRDPAQPLVEMDVVKQDLCELERSVKKLKLQILFKNAAVLSERGDSGWNPRGSYNDSETTHGSRRDKNQDKLPSLYNSEEFEISPYLREFDENFLNGLNRVQMLCLLTLSMFPENEIIKRSFVLHWWIGEGFIGPTQPRGKTAEELANEVFLRFLEKGFIEPFSEKRSWVVNRFRIDPFVRATVVRLAKREKFFDFDSNGQPTAALFISGRACLSSGETLDSQYMNKVRTLFNINEDLLDFDKPDMFSKMTKIVVLSLGRWQGSSGHYIEVDDTEFLDGLKDMKDLKFLNLQGISGITEIPASISNLTNLTILDLNGCSNLEEIPETIGSLQSLTHLDITDCYLMDSMPKKLSSLSKLEVLKGFVADNSNGNNSCTLEHLAKLKKLRKLTIYTGQKDFPTETDLRALHKFNALRKLRIEWRRGSLGSSGNVANENNANASVLDSPAELPAQLEKLDLQCFPQESADWLSANKLQNIKRLYVRGGILCDLGQLSLQREQDKWNVEILRLKFLNELEMDWIELTELFPCLIYFEKQACQKLTFFPCDEQGVWMK